MSIRVLTLVLVLPLLLAAQEYRGTILGRITDPSGAAVAGANIQITNIDTNVAVKAASNELGNYQVPFLLPGNYSVAVEHPGFRRLERKGIRVSINEKVTLDLSLELGATTESVTVTASAPLLSTANADLGQVIEKSYVNMLPLSLARNVVNLVYMTPGVTGSTASMLGDGMSNAMSITGGGGTRGRNEVLIDGLPNTVPHTQGLVVYVPLLDAVEEMRVHTTLFDAAYGHSNAGAISITTRSGTNELHGALYDFKRWRALNANSWNNNRLGLKKAPVRYYQWGYTINGPVYLPKLYDGRNRTFFSTSLERNNNKVDLNRQARMPTELERQGDFSQTRNRLGTALLAIYDPATTVITADGKAIRQPFAGARIPAARQSEIGKAVMNLYPLPNRPAVPQLSLYNWAANKLYWRPERQFSARVDHVISDRQRIYVRVGHLVLDQNSDLFFPGVYWFADGGYDSLGINAKNHWSTALDDTITFTPT